jgi:hypothetical protein
MSTFEEIFKIDDKRIIDLIMERLEERHIIENWETYSPEIVETWMSRIGRINK